MNKQTHIKLCMKFNLFKQVLVRVLLPYLDFIIFVAFIIKFIFYLFLIFYFLTLFFPNLGLQVNFTNLKTLLKLWNLMSESIVFKTILKYNLNTL